MTIILIINVALSTAVLAAVLSLLVWSIAAQHRSLPNAEMQTPTHRAGNFRRVPPHPSRASKSRLVEEWVAVSRRA